MNRRPTRGDAVAMFLLLLGWCAAFGVGLVCLYGWHCLLFVLASCAALLGAILVVDRALT